MSRKPPTGTQSVIRAVGLLKRLAAAAEPMELAELTVAAGLARTTTYRLLAALESEGLVTRDGAGAYRVGPVAVALGNRARSSNDLARSARPELERLARATGESVSLEVLTNGMMYIIEEAPGRHLMGTAPSVGTAWALHATSSGKALLATMPGAERDRLLRGRLRRFTPATITNRGELAAEIDAAGERGFAVNRGELEEGFSAVSAVIVDAFGDAVAALSVNAPSVRMGGAAMAEIGRRVGASARRVSRSLGAERA